MSQTKCGICLGAFDGELDLPTCQKCRFRFHFGKCSGSDSATWAKRGLDSKKKWTCHVCDPNKNMSKSKSGVFTPADFAGASGATSDGGAATSQLQPIQPTPMPIFNNVDEKFDYLVSQVSMLVAQNAAVLRELQQTRDLAAEANRKADINAMKVAQLEEQVRLDVRTISDLEYKNRSLEDYSRVDNLIIHGVPHPNTEAEAFALAFAVGKAAGLDIAYHNISACHSLGRPQNGVGRIVCRFGQRWLRNRLHTAINEKKPTTLQIEKNEKLDKLIFPSEPTKIYATDHFSPQTSHLYSEAKRLLAARFGGPLQHLWMRNRRIYSRRIDGEPVVEIRSLEQVRSLAGQREQRTDGLGNHQSN